MKISLRDAKVTDARDIHSLINFYANKREMLPRALNSIYEDIQKYVVAVSNKKVIGCAQLGVSWDELAEVKSLAVDPKYRGRQLGRKMVSALHKKAQQLGIRKIFCLTYRPGFFKELGYTLIPREKLPHKVWGECINCPHFPDCDEIPLMITLNEKKATKKKTITKKKKK